jgi:hypothetical protein
MEQDRPAGDAAAAEVWDKAEAEWVARLPQARAEIAYVRTAVQQFLISLDNPVML